MKSKPKYKKTSVKRLSLYFIIGIILVCIIVFILEATNTTDLFSSKNPSISSGSQSTKGEPVKKDPSTANAASDDNSASSPESNKVSNAAGSSTLLLDPSGNFVSAHKVPRNASVSSVCNTTPESTCVISFTSNGVTRALQSKRVDSGGSAYWDSWTPESIGLTVGSWKISATATLNNQSKTTVDSLQMEISQ